MTVPAGAVAALLHAIAARQPPGPEGQDVRLACAHLEACGCDPAAISEFTALLAAEPPEGHGENHIGADGRVLFAAEPGTCITCGWHAAPAHPWQAAS